MEENNKRIFDVTKRDFLFTALIFLAAVFGVFFGIFNGFHFGFTLTSFVTFVCLTVYLSKGVRKIKKFPLACGILALGLSAVFSVTSNGSVRFLGFVGTVILSLIWFVSLSDIPFKPGDGGLISTIFSPVFEQTLPNIPTTVTSLFSHKENVGKTIGKIAIGVAIAVPVLAVVIPLLMSSDAAFSGLVGSISGNLFMIAFKIGLALAITIVLLSYCFSLKKDSVNDKPVSQFAGVDNVILSSFLFVLSICYLLYLFSQLAYFFSAFKGILPSDYTFTLSEYARRGFFEMCVISVINLITVYVVLSIAKRNHGKLPMILRIICTFISVFSLVIIGTALSKMILYINHLGMTELRITTSSFMVFLAVVFAFLIFKVYIPKAEVLRAAVVTAGIVLILLGTVNVNRFVAEYNYQAYTAGKLETIDVQQIYSLGDEGIPYLLRLTQDADTNVKKQAKDFLLACIENEKYYDIEVEYSDDKPVFKVGDRKCKNIGEYTISKMMAYNVLDEFIENNVNEINTYLADKL